MLLNYIRAAILLVTCLLYVTPQAPILAAQEPNSPASEIFDPPRYRQVKLPDGTVEYTDLEVGVSFNLPRGWGLGNNGQRFLDWGWNGMGDGNIATSVALHHHRSDQTVWLYYCVFRHAYQLTPDQVDRWLDEEADDKISQKRLGEKLKGYRVRRPSYRHEDIGERKALEWVADFTQDNAAFAEYEAYVRGDKTLVDIMIRVPAAEIDSVREQVQPILKSVSLP
jgi:hypothetical protein